MSVTHNLLAVLVEGGLHKERPQSEAQRVVCVPDAGLPAGGAGLDQTTTSDTSYGPVRPVTDQ